MAKAFTLPEKPCELGKKFTTNGEGEGGERKSIAKFSIGLMFTGKELDKLAGNGTHARWYTKDSKSGEIIPAFDDVGEIPFSHRYTDSTITLDLDGTTLTLPKSKFMHIRAQRQNGGNTHIDLDVETPADLIDGVTDIGNFGGRKIRAQLAFGEKAGADDRQPELPMDHEAEEDDDEQPAKAKKGNGNGKGVHV